MVKLNFNRIMKGRAIERPYSYLVKAGFSRNISIRMIAGTVRVLRLENLERLCLLFQCTPNDLFEWIPGREITDAEFHPLKSLIRTENMVDLRIALNALPYEKLAEVEKFIAEKTKQR
jgi:DNA-binding Xre family transcriptional regulator